MKRVNVNLFPRDGYIFVESDGSKHRGDDWSKLMAKVSEYRKRAKLPQGDVEAEVMAQACARNPSHCHEENGANAKQLAVTSLKGRALRYLSFLRSLGNKIPWVSAQEAAERANICASCPYNTPLPEGCSSCRAAVKAMHNEILGRGRKQDARLNGCAILGESLQASVHVDHDVVDNSSLPGHCFRKKRTP
jgi:hypothetical protein